MDKFTELMLGRTGLIAMVGKAERGAEAVAAIRKYKAAYLMAVGGAAYLVSKAIRASRVVAFGDLGMEAIYEFEVKDMPVTVAVDASGESVHETGPAEWRGRITIEISNTTPLPAKIYAGEGIAQILFLKGEAVCKTSYADKKGKYQDQKGLTLPFVQSGSQRT